jgi:hypothetical protein
VLPLFGDKKPELFLQTLFNEQHARFSPDGKWIAYVSDESGTPEVYVQSGIGEVTRGGPAHAGHYVGRAIALRTAGAKQKGQPVKAALFCLAAFGDCAPATRSS